MGKYRKLDIILTEDQRSSLEMIVRRGMGSAMEIRRANVILMVDGSLGKGMKDVDVAKALGITPQAVHNIKARFIDSTAGHGEEAARKAEDAVSQGNEQPREERRSKTRLPFKVNLRYEISEEFSLG